MSILFKKIRVYGFRGLQNIEVELESTTVLTGMNNTGKTSFLKAFQIALGNRQFITQDDFYISDSNSSKEIIIDIYIAPVHQDGNICNDFSENWEVLFTEERIMDIEGKAFIPLRTIVIYDEVTATYKSKQYILPEWPPFENKNLFWYQTVNGNEKAFHYDEVPFFYMEAQRDILEDIKAKSSYLGKMISKIEYSKEDMEKIELQIKELNELTVNNSPILSNIKDTLKELGSAMDTLDEGVEITPFTKKIRDLNKGISIYYSEKKDSFSMEYHGMGTRSWSSLLTLKSFINLLDKKAENQQVPFFPILTIEEPEAHLHPNAQKKLYSQIKSIKGQKIISTHSPYIAASAELYQLRNFYKDVSIKCGQINIEELKDEDIRRIKRQVIKTRGEIFFSKVIVLFEGETEEQALPIFAKHFFKKTPYEMGIDFVGVGGHGNYLPFLRVAEALRVPWFILSDGEKKVVENVKGALKKLYNREIEIEKESNIVILENEYSFEKYLLECNFVQINQKIINNLQKKIKNIDSLKPLVNRYFPKEKLIRELTKLKFNENEVNQILKNILENDYIDEIKSAFEKLHSKTYLEDEIRKKDGTKKDRIKTDAICDKCTQNIYKDILRDYKGDPGFKDALYDCMILQKTRFGPAIAETIIENKKPLPPKVTELFESIKSLLEKRDSDE